VRQADVDDDLIGGMTRNDAQKLHEFEQEVKELRRVQRRSAASGPSTYFARKLRSPSERQLRDEVTMRSL